MTPASHQTQTTGTVTDSKNFEGLFTALITPFDKNGKINLAATEKFIEFQIEKGIHGLFVGGSTGECFLQTEAERREFLQAVPAMVKNRIPLIAHIGCISTEATLRLGAVAEAAGYHAVSAVRPFYYNFRPEEIKMYYMDLIENLSLPIFYYHVELNGGAFSVEQFAPLLATKKMVGLKYMGSHPEIIRSVKEHAAELKVFYGEHAAELKVFYGKDENFLSGLEQGADGGIGGTYNAAPGIYIDLYNAYKRGDLAEAKALQEKATAYVNLLKEIGSVYSGIKGLIHLMGIDCGTPRKPFAPLKKEDWQKLEAYLKAHDELMPTR